MRSETLIAHSSPPAPASRILQSGVLTVDELPPLIRLVQLAEDGAVLELLLSGLSCRPRLRLVSIATNVVIRVAIIFALVNIVPGSRLPTPTPAEPLWSAGLTLCSQSLLPYAPVLSGIMLRECATTYCDELPHYAVAHRHGRGI